MLRNWSGVGGGGDDHIPCTCTHVGCCDALLNKKKPKPKSFLAHIMVLGAQPRNSSPAVFIPRHKARCLDLLNKFSHVMLEHALTGDTACRATNH